MASKKRESSKWASTKTKDRKRKPVQFTFSHEAREKLKQMAVTGRMSEFVERLILEAGTLEWLQEQVVAHGEVTIRYERDYVIAAAGSEFYGPSLAEAVKTAIKDFLTRES